MLSNTIKIRIYDVDTGESIYDNTQDFILRYKSNQQVLHRLLDMFIARTVNSGSTSMRIEMWCQQPLQQELPF